MFDSATYEQVAGVMLRPETARITFELLPLPGVPGRPRELLWRSVPDATGVVPYAQSAVTFYQLSHRQEQARQALTFGALQNRITCQYCGRSIEVSEVDRNDPRCPGCSAPLTTILTPA